MNMDSLVSAVRDLFGFITGVKPQYRLHGGSNAENLALQNIQVRSLPSASILSCTTSCTSKLTSSTDGPTGTTADGYGVHVRSASAFRSRTTRWSARPRQRQRRREFEGILYQVRVRIFLPNLSRRENSLTIPCWVCSCSSADINPIGSISKTDLRRFIAYSQERFRLPILERYVLVLLSGSPKRGRPPH